jgi:ElaB/YqjD/DUF883 family membrane-anchored ribosome-binding protein
MQHQDTSQQSEHGSQRTGQPRSNQPHAADPWGERQGQNRRAGAGERGERDDGSGDVAEAAKHAYDRLEHAGGEVRSHLERIARDGRSRIADEIRTVGEAADAAAERLSGEEHDRIGGYVQSIRRQCDRAAQYLEQHDVQSMLRGANDLARRNPALVLGGAAVIGLVAGRFLSARPPRDGARDGADFDADDWGAGSRRPWGEEQSAGDWSQGAGQQQQRQPGATGIAGSPGAGRAAGPAGASSRPFGGTTGRPLGSAGAGSTARPGETGSSIGASGSSERDKDSRAGGDHSDKRGD